MNSPLPVLLSAYSVSQLGNWLFRTGVVYYAYNQHHGSNALLTTAIVLVYLPVLFGSRLLAPLADRRDTRRTLIGLDGLRATVLTMLLIAVWAGIGFTSAVTIGVMAFLSLLTPFFTASQTAYLRRVLPAERIPGALAALSRVDWLTFVLGTAAAPLMLQVTNLPALIFLDIITFVVSGLLLVKLATAPTADGAGRGVPGSGAGRPRLTASSRLLLAGVFALNAGAGLINVYPNVVARDFLGGGAFWLSAINLANGVGGVVGATLAGRLRTQRGLRPALVAGLVISVSLACMTFVTTAWVAIAASTVMLGAGQVFAVLFQARILANEPVGVAGRVSGYFTLGTFAGVTVSVLMFIGIVDVGPMRRSFTVLLLVAAVCAAVAAATGYVAVRRYGNNAAAAADPPEPPPAGQTLAGPEADGKLVRQAGRSFATGVVVATTVSDGVPHATTVNSFATVSLDPALVLVCFDHTSRLGALVSPGTPLGLTILSARQEHTARHFARGDRPDGDAQFAEHPWRAGERTGAPLLQNGMGWLECTVQSVVPAGDHSIVVARVSSWTPSDDVPHDPLLFFGGRFRALNTHVDGSGPSPDLQTEARERPDHQAADLEGAER
ncbi:flavin reductase [Actinacidiphila sp. ITFR-21]|uniref:flavin reductase n=1 Tax=Actinacidiphila sp. ITFR-21 TaxID=3075199 RepID=UPI002889367B|nr:flavin reductase [Streptomyces sp. ITFR-21]WNI16165.1 flavin reductase [Streptomyces sp. ITFR-21]